MVWRSRGFICLKGSCTDGKEANSAAALASRRVMIPLEAGKRSLLRAGVRYNARSAVCLSSVLAFVGVLPPIRAFLCNVFGVAGDIATRSVFKVRGNA